MSQEHVDAVRRSLAGWNSDDFDECASIAHPDIEWGVAGLRSYWDEWHELWDVRLEPTEIRDLGDTVLVLAMTSARGDSSGVGFEQLMGYVYEFEDGMARRVRSYHDPDDALAAVSP
jgi:ketosteroid isomerase-like protein